MVSPSLRLSVSAFSVILVEQVRRVVGERTPRMATVGPREHLSVSVIVVSYTEHFSA